MNYQAMAAALNVTLCRGRTPSGHYCQEQHDKEGSITNHPSPKGAVIHFSDRPHHPKSANANTLAFLKLVARVQEPSIDMDEPWRRVYRLNQKVRFLARFLKIPNPATPAHADKAFVLASVASLNNDVPMRKQAYNWARRGPERKMGS